MIPGEIIPRRRRHRAQRRPPDVTLTVANTGDRPIQVGSHYHFFETNAALAFDRDQARGMRLTSPPAPRCASSPASRARSRWWPMRGEPQGLRLQPEDHGGALMALSHVARAPTPTCSGRRTGDKVRLADTDLVIEVEQDRTVYGEEVKFGGGKVIRDGMGQGQATRAAGAVDTVITNALILDHWGIVKADIGLKDGRIAAIGKAGNPDTQPGVDIVIGPGTEVIAGEGKIVTAGGIDAHIHFICPQILDEALTAGVTTLFGGGTGPAAGTTATTCTPGPWHIGRMLQAAEAFPINVGLLGKGNASLPEALREQVAAGACGLKLHEDWGTTPGRDRLLPRRRRRAWTCRWRSTPTR